MKDREQLNAAAAAAAAAVAFPPTTFPTVNLFLLRTTTASASNRQDHRCRRVLAVRTSKPCHAGLPSWKSPSFKQACRFRVGKDYGGKAAYPYACSTSMRGHDGTWMC